MAPPAIRVVPWIAKKVDQPTAELQPSDTHDGGLDLQRVLETVCDTHEFESRVNYTLDKYDDAICCTYDLSRFSASVIMDAMRVHPAVIIGGIYQENPFYVPPDEFLRELRERAGQNSTGVG